MLLFAESVEQAKLVLLLFWGSRGNGESPDSIPEHLAPIRDAHLLPSDVFVYHLWLDLYHSA